MLQGCTISGGGRPEGVKGNSAAKEVKTKRVVPQDKVKVRVRVVVGGES